MATIEKRLRARGDYSSFLVHLIRRQKGVRTEKTLRDILQDKVLEARIVDHEHLLLD